MRLRIHGSTSDISSSSSSSTSSEPQRQPHSPTSTKLTPTSLSSRIRRIFKGPPRPTETHPLPRRNEPTEPYTHIPIVASSAFLKTTTRTDMFELTGNGRLNISRSMNDLHGQGRVLASRASESRLKHIEAAARDLSRGERGPV